MTRKKAKTARGRREGRSRPKDTGGPRCADENHRGRRYFVYAMVCVLSLALGAAVTFFALHGIRRPVSAISDTDIRDIGRRLGALLSAAPDSLGDIDIAEMNLLCAAGLPGADEIDIDKLLATLDEWAERVKLETNRNLHVFRRNPNQYENSEAYFRAMMLVTVLQKDLGVRYNPERIRDVDFKRSEDLFIHGMIASDNGGTCVSMPVLYVAVGRRVGYPLKLVLAKAHVFVRWDSPDGELFNIEATNQGMNSFDDEYYKTWPQKMTPAEIASGCYLKSLGAAGELALFLATRGHCLLDNGRTSEAQIAYAQAHHLAPGDPRGLAYLANAVNRESAEILGRRTGRGSRDANAAGTRYPLADLRKIQAINEYNRRMMDQRAAVPPGPGAAPRRQPHPPSADRVRPPNTRR